MLLLSANKTDFTPWVFNGRAFLNNKNKRGPKLEPCDKPCTIFLRKNVCLSILCNISVFHGGFFNKL